MNDRGRTGKEKKKEGCNKGRKKKRSQSGLRTVQTPGEPSGVRRFGTRHRVSAVEETHQDKKDKGERRGEKKSPKRRRVGKKNWQGVQDRPLGVLPGGMNAQYCSSSVVPASNGHKTERTKDKKSKYGAFTKPDGVQKSLEKNKKKLRDRTEVGRPRGGAEPLIDSIARRVEQGDAIQLDRVQAVRWKRNIRKGVRRQKQKGRGGGHLGGGGRPKTAFSLLKRGYGRRRPMNDRKQRIREPWRGGGKRHISHKRGRKEKELEA